MRINTHCHVFTAKSVYTNGFKENFRNRARMTLESLGIPPSDGLLKRLMKIIDDLVNRAPGGDEGDTVLEQREFLFRKLTGLLKPVFKALLGKVPFVDFLAIALLPDIDHVTDYLFLRDKAASAGPEGKEVVLVPLMMDILQTRGLLEEYQYPGENGATLALLQEQAKGTQRQVLRYPGKVLPFYTVNPLRPDFAPLFEQAMDQGFVGLKVYPSLGYQFVETRPGVREYRVTGAMLPTLSACQRNGYPVMMHCNNAGFALTRVTAEWCEPLRYARALEKELPELKWCYGHFGGGTFYRKYTKFWSIKRLKQLLYPDNPHYLWCRNIQKQMRDMGGRVFADVSCHVEALKPEESGAYFNALASVLRDPALVGQMLWGTDYFLDQMSCDEYEFWVHFEEQLKARDPELFRRMAHDNPARYLGLPDGDGTVGKNIENYARYIYKNRDHEAFNPKEMAAWLRNYYDAHKAEFPGI